MQLKRIYKAKGDLSKHVRRLETKQTLTAVQAPNFRVIHIEAEEMRLRLDALRGPGLHNVCIHSVYTELPLWDKYCALC